MSSAVRPLGGLTRIGPDGTIVNTSSREHLPDTLNRAIEPVVRVYQEVLGTNLHSVYLRGSAVRGTFVHGVSDLDTWALSHQANEGEPRVVTHPYDRFVPTLSATFGCEIELCHTSLPRLAGPDAAFARMLLATQGLCVHGPDHIPSLGTFRPGTETLGHALHIAESVDELLVEELEDVAAACRWICKAVVRAGLEVHAHEHGQYTRDLWPCYALFAAFHPTASVHMLAVLERAVTPTSELADFHSLLRRIQIELLPSLLITSLDPGDPS